jgi:hypothetical protein
VQLSVSSPSNGKVIITVMLKIPPIKNQEIFPRPLFQGESGCRCTWELNANAAGRMVQALRYRKLVSKIHCFMGHPNLPQNRLVGANPRKISLATDGVELVDIRSPVPSQVSHSSVLVTEQPPDFLPRRSRQRRYLPVRTSFGSVGTPSNRHF